jgi:hypothetical protein
MGFWFFSTDPYHSRRCPGPPTRPFLEPLEDRCLPSSNVMAASASVAPTSSASTPPAAVNTIASLSHDQIHMLQDQSQQQTDSATIRLEVEQAVLGILRQFASQEPQFQAAIAFLTNAIPAQEATVTSLQNQTNLLNQLDDLQDQALILNATIQNVAALVPVQQQLGNVQAASTLQGIIASDQATVQSLQPQITAVEVEVSAFV